MTYEQKLEKAGKNYGACAKKLSSKLATKGHPNETEAELLIAFGIASDWVRRAAALQQITYNRGLMNRSARASTITSLMKFTMAWSAANALFARKSVRGLLSSTDPSGELKRFKLLFDHASLPAADVSSYTATLHSLLSCHITTRIPLVPLGTPVTTLHALHFKYTPPEMRSKGVCKTVENALASGNLGPLDLHAIIYLARNWSIHGAVVDSSFRNATRFNKFTGTVLEALADTHIGISIKIESAI